VGEAPRLSAGELSADEQAFLDGPVEELCGMLHEWDTVHQRMDLSPEVWKFIARRASSGSSSPNPMRARVLAFAHTEIVTKISTRSGNRRGDR
jgi:acyl-CoA dehydrogenase